MSLNYQLRDGMTNADLPHEGEDHFAFCVMMMHTGVQRLDDKGLATFKERVAQSLAIDGPSSPYSPEEQVAYYSAYADLCKGMTTNISPKSPTKWKETLVRIAQELGADLTRRAAKVEEGIPL